MKTIYKYQLGFAIALTLLLTGSVAAFSVYCAGEYGFALFILTPVFIGLCSAALYGYKRDISRREAFETGFITLLLFVFGLLLLAFEGLICIAMMAPLAIPLTAIGSYLGYLITRKKPGISNTAVMLLLTVIPTLAFMERDIEPELTTVTTRVEINADPQTVWENVIEFPQLDEPDEFIFKTGIAYPINARITGRGVGSVRHCNFTTGPFVEPVTVWDEPHVLQFDVTEQPVPMNELSFREVDAPHLHGYFVSKKGRFTLTPLAGGKTLLEGTTWYYHDIRPAFYWKLWSDMIIHKIHSRVLAHIKANAEKQKGHNHEDYSNSRR